MTSKDRHINFAQLRDQVLRKQGGKEYWRSLAELTDSPEFNDFIHREYPSQAEVWDDPVNRRSFIKLMSASLALAGLSACTYQPAEKIVPYVRQPEEEIPGKALYFATAMPLSGVGTGLLVRSNEGRPTKIEGNPDHPDSLGATDIFSQASLLTLYDPDRSQTVTFREAERPWSTFLGEMSTALEEQRKTQGAGLRILTETVSSPTLAAQLRALLAAFPSAKWHQYEPAARSHAQMAAMLVFGQPVNTIYRFEEADRILSLGSDFLACGPGSLKYARDFAARRRIVEGKREMNRLYVVEPTPTNTGAKADHRLSVRPSEMEAFVRTLAQQIVGKMGDVTKGAPGYTQHAGWISALVSDLQQSRGRSIVIVGDEQPPVIHALAHAINQALGNVGTTVIYTDPIEANPVDQIQSLRELVNDMNSGAAQLLVILGGNPVYNAPVDFNFTEALKKVPLRVHLSLYKDETSELCHWHIPESHYLETWSDTRAYDGTVSIIQPLIEPLYDSRSAHEMLAIFTGQSDIKPYDMLRNFWQSQMGGGGAHQSSTGGAAQTTTGANQPTTSSNQSTTTGGQTTSGGNRPIINAPMLNATTDFEQAWRKMVHDGIVPNTALVPKQVALKGDWASQLPSLSQSGSANSYDILFRTDPSIYDGRFANNGWLQELPKPLTKLTWDNAALISPATARRLGIGNRVGSKGGDWQADMVHLSYQGRTLTMPVWILPGQSDNTVTVHLGYGRRRAGQVGTGTADKPVGFNAYLIRTSDTPWAGTGLQVAKAGGEYTLATTQLHFNMENRDVVRAQTLEEYLKNPDESRERAEGGKEGESSESDSMYPPYDYKNQGENAYNYAWGMAIDTTSCVGCNACIVACQSENNIPIVGKERVERSREMHWLRVDTYFSGQDENNPKDIEFMPVPCMHCENAPCEPVCPVHATVHSAEGLNDMVYNRCVGTRYCSNNCPYKVRRFNFFLYTDWEQPTYKLMRNPEVTVRSRGVMEKCTYCVQRIQWGKIEAEKEGRRVRDGEVQTACQTVCPTEAIVFGDINDPESRVSKLKAEHRNYSLLADLNTQPRTTYLSSLRNPNPNITEKA
ncbi:MAG TPA: TAT-variant-translocated molybdopterin oxidoreductase [Pyrinomonadaceae bacterium]|jgi:molybdopterin-containing oxidoreductase family iron-sulfur binding subunit